MLTALRKQFDVTDDAEWAVIAERIGKVNELRRATAGAAFGGFQRGGNGPNRASHPEQDALVAAVKDNLPDAEIKSRLERLRSARKQAEASLDEARESLRSVLTVRQEAVAVLAGLLP